MVLWFLGTLILDCSFQTNQSDECKRISLSIINSVLTAPHFGFYRYNTENFFLQRMLYKMELRDRAKSFQSYFWILLPAYYHAPGSYKSTRTKSFRKFEQKLGQNQSQSSWVQKNAIFTGLKFEIGTFAELEWLFLTLAIFCWVGLVVASTIAEKNPKNIEKSGTISIFETLCI